MNTSTYNRMLYDKSIKAAASPTLCEQLEKKKVNPVYNESKEDSWGTGMTLLCQATDTTLDDYYDWSVPRVMRDRVDESLDQVDREYSNQLHGYIQDCLQDEESERTTQEQNLEFFKNHKEPARRKQLVFGENRKVYAAPPPPKVVVKEKLTQ